MRKCSDCIKSASRCDLLHPFVFQYNFYTEILVHRKLERGLANGDWGGGEGGRRVEVGLPVIHTFSANRRLSVYMPMRNVSFAVVSHRPIRLLCKLESFYYLTVKMDLSWINAFLKLPVN